MHQTVKVETSIGEMLDKISILEIKKQKFTDPTKLHNVNEELTLLQHERDQAIVIDSDTQKLIDELDKANLTLWETEDSLRDCERNKDFGDNFVALSRKAFKTNDLRCSIKRQINEKVNSRLFEEKGYSAY